MIIVNKITGGKVHFNCVYCVPIFNYFNYLCIKILYLKL